MWAPRQFDPLPQCQPYASAPRDTTARATPAPARKIGGRRLIPACPRTASPGSATRPCSSSSAASGCSPTRCCGRRLGHLRRHGPTPAAGTADALDAVLISHLHLDHLDLPSLKQLPRCTRLLVPRGAGDFLRRRGFHAVEELAAGERAASAGST